MAPAGGIGIGIGIGMPMGGMGIPGGICGGAATRTAVCGQNRPT